MSNQSMHAANASKNIQIAARRYGRKGELLLLIIRAWEERSRLDLTADDVKILLRICQTVDLGPYNPYWHNRGIQNFQQKLSKAQNAQQGLRLTAIDIETFQEGHFRDQLYHIWRKETVEVDLWLWIELFRKTYIDGSHCLDYQWHGMDDPSTCVARDDAEIAAMNAANCLRKPHAREQLAIQWYFSVISCIRKLKEAKHLNLEAIFSSYEARILSLIYFKDPKVPPPSIYPSLTEESRLNLSKNSPAWSTMRYLAASATKHKVATLTSEEVTLCLTALDDIPIPKIKPPRQYSDIASMERQDIPLGPSKWVKEMILKGSKTNMETMKGAQDNVGNEKDSLAESESFEVLRDKVLELNGENYKLYRKLHRTYEDKNKIELSFNARNREIALKETEMKRAYADHNKREQKAREIMKQSLAKKLVEKDREMVQKQADMNHQRESHNNREQTSKEKISKLESELVAANDKLQKALKQPDEVRNEFSAKIQRIHNKVAKLEKDLKAEQEAHAITKLDSASTTEKLSRHKEAHNRFVIKATDLKKERDDAREERDTLRAARMTPAQLDDTKASEIARAVEEAIEPLNITIGTLEATIAGLRSDERMERSREAVEAIQELEKLKVKYRTLSEDLITERNARDQDKISRVSSEKHLEEQISWLRYRLDGEEAASAVLRDLIAQQPNENENYMALEAQLAEAQERISQLESTNSQYRDLSMMLQNVEKF